MKKTLFLLAAIAATIFTSCDLTSTYAVKAGPTIFFSADSTSEAVQNLYVLQKLVDLEFLDYAGPDQIVGYYLQQNDVPTAEVEETLIKLYKQLKTHYDQVYPKVLAYDYSTLFDTTVVQNVGFTMVAAWSDSTIYTVRIVLPDTTKIK